MENNFERVRSEANLKKKKNTQKGKINSRKTQRGI